MSNLTTETRNRLPDIGVEISGHDDFGSLERQ
jgi:hypothetical protein